MDSMVCGNGILKLASLRSFDNTSVGSRSCVLSSSWGLHSQRAVGIFFSFLRLRVRSGLKTEMVLTFTSCMLASVFSLSSWDLTSENDLSFSVFGPSGNYEVSLVCDCSS